jgi:hypothetical protein
VINLEFRVTDSMTLTATFGKDYADPSLRRRSAAVSILGVSFGLGSQAAF